jgi:aryl-alcohol dehydrogenase-like predicted oxidoreductase
MTYGRPPAAGEPKAGRHAWALNEDESQPFLKQALDLGINFFDTANVYSSGASEEVLGRFLKGAVRRESVVVATKVHGVMRDEPNGRGLSRKAILHELDESLRRLQMDFVDLYQIHRWDYETPIEETLEVLHDVVKAGKVRYIGASSMYSWQFAKALYLADRHGDAICVDAEPLQPSLSGRGAGDDSSVPGRRGWGDSVESAGEGAVGASVAERDDEAVGDRQLREQDVRANGRGGSQGSG